MAFQLVVILKKLFKNVKYILLSKIYRMFLDIDNVFMTNDTNHFILFLYNFVTARIVYFLNKLFFYLHIIP